MKRASSILPEALKNVFKKPVTVSYPAGREDVLPGIRGKLVFDSSKCVGCMMCVRDCPAKAIEIEKVGDKKFKALLGLDNCVFCGQCVDSCAKCALQSTEEFELTGFDREKMKVEI